MPYLYAKLTDLKNRARRIAREENVRRHQALDIAAQRGGFQNYMHAKNLLPDDFQSPLYSIEIRQHWRERAHRRHGVASYTVQLTAPLKQLVQRHHLVGYLGGCATRPGDVLVSDGFMRDRRATQIDLGKITRALQFIDVTGLKPSSTHPYPRRRWTNRPPIADHDFGWYDPETRTHILSTEPYSDHAERDPEQKAWEERHGWATIRVEWGSIYGFSTEMLLLCPKDYAPTLIRKAARLDRSAPPIRTEDILVGDAVSA